VRTVSFIILIRVVHTDCLHRQGELQHTFYSLNEFIVNRGLSGVLSTLEVYVDGQLVTTAQGDGTL
jgi:NAD kinase